MATQLALDAHTPRSLSPITELTTPGSSHSPLDEEDNDNDDEDDATPSHHSQIGETTKQSSTWTPQTSGVSLIPFPKRITIVHDDPGGIKAFDDGGNANMSLDYSFEQGYREAGVGVGGPSQSSRPRYLRHTTAPLNVLSMVGQDHPGEGSTKRLSSLSTPDVRTLAAFQNEYQGVKPTGDWHHHSPLHMDPLLSTSNQRSRSFSGETPGIRARDFAVKVKPPNQPDTKPLSMFASSSTPPAITTKRKSVFLFSLFSPEPESSKPTRKLSKSRLREESRPLDPNPVLDDDTRTAIRMSGTFGIKDDGSEIYQLQASDTTPRSQHSNGSVNSHGIRQMLYAENPEVAREDGEERLLSESEDEKGDDFYTAAQESTEAVFGTPVGPRSNGPSPIDPIRMVDEQTQTRSRRSSHTRPLPQPPTRTFPEGIPFNIPSPPSRDSPETPPDLPLLIASHLLSTHATTLLRHSANMREVSESMQKMARESLDWGGTLMDLASRSNLPSTLPDPFTTPRPRMSFRSEPTPSEWRHSERRRKGASLPADLFSEADRLGRQGWTNLHAAEEAWSGAMEHLRQLVEASAPFPVEFQNTGYTPEQLNVAPTSVVFHDEPSPHERPGSRVTTGSKGSVLSGSRKLRKSRDRRSEEVDHVMSDGETELRGQKKKRRWFGLKRK